MLEKDGATNPVCQEMGKSLLIDLVFTGARFCKGAVMYVGVGGLFLIKVDLSHQFQAKLKKSKILSNKTYIF